MGKTTSGRRAKKERHRAVVEMRAPGRIGVVVREPVGSTTSSSPVGATSNLITLTPLSHPFLFHTHGRNPLRILPPVRRPPPPMPTRNIGQMACRPNQMRLSQPLSANPTREGSKEPRLCNPSPLEPAVSTWPCLCHWHTPRLPLPTLSRSSLRLCLACACGAEPPAHAAKA